MNFMVHYCTETCFDRDFEILQTGYYKKQRAKIDVMDQCTCRKNIQWKMLQLVTNLKNSIYRPLQRDQISANCLTSAILPRTRLSNAKLFANFWGSIVRLQS